MLNSWILLFCKSDWSPLWRVIQWLGWFFKYGVGPPKLCLAPSYRPTGLFRVHNECWRRYAQQCYGPVISAKLWFQSDQRKFWIDLISQSRHVLSGLQVFCFFCFILRILLFWCFWMLLVHFSRTLLARLRRKSLDFAKGCLSLRYCSCRQARFGMLRYILHMIVHRQCLMRFYDLWSFNVLLKSFGSKNAGQQHAHCFQESAWAPFWTITKTWKACNLTEIIQQFWLAKDSEVLKLWTDLNEPLIMYILVYGTCISLILDDQIMPTMCTYVRTFL